MGTFTNFAIWTERQIHALKQASKPKTFKQALKENRKKMAQMVDEVKIYKDTAQLDWRGMILVALAKFIKAEGGATPSRLGELDKDIQSMDWIGAQRDQGFKLFYLAIDYEGLTFPESLLAFKEFWTPDNKTSLILILFLFGMAQVDGNMSPIAQAAIEDACRILNIPFEETHKLHLDCQAGSERKQAAYTLLKSVQSDSTEVIKERYRELVKEFHPDTIASKNLSAEFVAFAEDKFKRIQAAYEAIIRDRAT